ncbi:sulfurtransferase TusA family protein [Candidatus Desantisbacteria bacterium]|nr:sulfurtransferase TusA family protein [Candidatus Desantisbacteria bacterium]
MTDGIKENKIKKFLDLKGVICPMNFVKTKIALDMLEKDDLMEIILDEGEPIHNVPRSLKEEGHQVIKVEKLGSTFKVLIKKG